MDSTMDACHKVASLEVKRRAEVFSRMSATQGLESLSRRQDQKIRCHDPGLCISDLALEVGNFLDGREMSGLREQALEVHGVGAPLLFLVQHSGGRSGRWTWWQWRCRTKVVEVVMMACNVPCSVW